MLSVKALFIVPMISLAISQLPANTGTYYQPPREYEIVKAEVSGYTSSIEETDDTPHLTASGKNTRVGTIACPSRLSFGTEVHIEGIVYICEDRMNRRYRDREVYDIWFETKVEAYQWGRKSLDIKVYARD